MPTDARRKNPGGPRNPAIDEAIRLIREEGVSGAEAARRAGCSDGALRNRLRSMPDRPVLSPGPGGADRRDLYERIAALRADGLSFGEIAARLGTSPGYAGEVYNDPTGEATRARKTRRSRPCEGCGTQIGNNGSEPPRFCRSCRDEHDRSLDARRAASNRQYATVWSDDAILTCIRDLALAGSASMNAYRRLRESLPPGAMPSPSTILARFVTWNDAVRAADLEPQPAPYDEYGGMTNEQALDCVARCARDVGRTPSYTDYERWARGRPDAYSGSLIRLRFASSWVAATDAYEILLQRGGPADER